jgi:predicted house-cleaning noncanonical NTP pyrophosphatase (MazG superfamily)
MKDLIEENYKSIVKRGLITEKTSLKEFTDKLDEEVKEFKEYYDPEELADIILVCLNIAKHWNIDIEKELKKKIEINFNR